MSALLPGGSQPQETAQPDEKNDPLAPVEAAFRQLKANSTPGLSCIGAIKNAFVRARALAAETNRAKGGRAAGELLSDFADRLLNQLLGFASRRSGLAPETAGADSSSRALVGRPAGSPGDPEDRPTEAPLSGPAGPGIALFALGSYARRELAPYSDLDFLLLRADDVPETGLGQLVSHLLHPLWDAGLHVGYAVRSRKECLQALDEIGTEENALETATAMLESRFVAGRRALADKLHNEDLPDFLRRLGRVFVETKHEETLRRWQGQSVYRTQPHLKDSPGALRDFQLAVWLDKAAQLSGHLPRLKDRPLVSPAAIEEARAGYERLLTFRVSLHALCGRQQDVLDFAMQQAVAEDLAYQGTEQFTAAEELLRDYFRAAAAVYRLAHTVTRRYQEERAIATEDVERLRRKPVDEDFVRIGDYLYAARSGLFSGADWLEPAFRAFLHAAQLGVAVSQDIGEAIHARLPELQEAVRGHHEAAAYFITLLRGRNHVARTLRSMRDIGLLGSYVPEFGEIEGLAVNDVYHEFTVDEHTLYTIAVVDRLYQATEPGSTFKQNILNNLRRPYLLRLAALFHDLGKSRGGPGHSERGALMVPAIGERLGLSAADVRTLIFLVAEHLTLSKAIQHRDLGEGPL
ncbi:MAG: HD domain-containing protein, partial [Planctomycetota bacterium]